MNKKPLLSAGLLTVFTLLFVCLVFLQSSVPVTDSTGYTPDLSKEYLVTQYSDATGVQATFYTIESEESFGRRICEIII